ncbi:MAG: hypothetical protein RQ783_06795 [Gammaproteobacteria bacterium]|nr:hypothetical protein [Gammaproteobacteria bacterium]
MKSFDPNFTDEPFLCPNCGSTRCAGSVHVSIPFPEVMNSSDPWSGVLEWQTCQQCKKSIPAHIAERWNGMTIEQAKQEWQDGIRKRSTKKAR